MAGSIKVDPAVLKSTATKVDTQAAEYRKQFGNLYTEVETLKAAWQGVDNQAFTAQIDSFKPEFEKMAKLMEDYSAFLRNAADNYQKTQDAIAGVAKKL